MKSIKELLEENNFNDYRDSYKVYAPKKDVDVFDFMELVNGWEEIVGDKLIKNTIPLKLNNKALTILTSHPVYAQQLTFMEKILIMKIEKSFPQMQGLIQKIFFKADNAFFNKKIVEVRAKEIKKEEFSQKWHKQSPEYKRLEKEALQNLGQINDQEMREQFVSLYIQLKSQAQK